ncbi:hypothetical protein HDR63_03165 [bacterium]|nr:hypothetical protein [bacterium]
MPNPKVRLEWRHTRGDRENMSGRWIRFLGFLNAVLAFVGSYFFAGHTHDAVAAPTMSTMSLGPMMLSATGTTTGATTGVTTGGTPTGTGVTTGTTGTVTGITTGTTTASSCFCPTGAYFPLQTGVTIAPTVPTGYVETPLSGTMPNGARYRVWANGVTLSGLSSCTEIDSYLYQVPARVVTEMGALNAVGADFCITTGCYAAGGNYYCKGDMNSRLNYECSACRGSGIAHLGPITGTGSTIITEVWAPSVFFTGPFTTEFLGCVDGFYEPSSISMYGATGSSIQPSTGLFQNFCAPCPGITYVNGFDATHNSSTGCDLCGPLTADWNYANAYNGTLPTGNGFQWYAESGITGVWACRARPLSSSGVNVGRGTDDTGTYEVVVKGECTYQ